MRKAILFYSLTLASMMLVGSSVLTSCTKEKTIIQKDSIVTENTLIQSEWKIEEAMSVYGGMKLKYKRGEQNSWNLDKDYYVFKKDHTGYSYDGNNAKHEIKNWQLKDSAGRMVLTFTYVNDSRYNEITSNITWDYLRIKNGQLIYVDYFTDAYNGNHYHGHSIRSRR